MLRHPFAKLTLCAFAVTIAGCGVLETKKIDYKSSGQAPTLEVPPDLTAPTPSDRFALPDSGSRGSATLSTYNAEREFKPGAGESRDVLTKPDNMRVERAGDERWLVIKGMSADEIWPKLRNFWIETGFLLNIDAPSIGVMETDWAENRAKLPQDFIRSTIGKLFDSVYSVPERDKFRTRVEQGVEAGTLDVFISHRSVVEEYETGNEGPTVWKPSPADPELEAEMLRRMMIYLGADQAYAEAQSEQPARAEQALIENQDGATTLKVLDPYARAWRRVGLALDRIGFTVQDRNRAEGVYFVRYIDPQKDADIQQGEKGILASLMFWRSDDDTDARTGDEYRIQIADTGDNAARVVVQNKAGQVENSRTARRIIELLHEQLK